MRRAATSLLLVLISLPLIAQVLLARTASSVPSCCRRHGSHHCSMEAKVQPAGAKTISRTCSLFTRVQVTPAGLRDALAAQNTLNDSSPIVGLTITAPTLQGSPEAQFGAIRKRGPPAV